jgi:hypothetical protein
MSGSQVRLYSSEGTQTGDDKWRKMEEVVMMRCERVS